MEAQTPNTKTIAYHAEGIGRIAHCNFQTKGSYLGGHEITIEVMSSNETRLFNFTVPALTRYEAGEYKTISLSAWPRLGDVGWEVWRYPVVLDYAKGVIKE